MDVDQGKSRLISFICHVLNIALRPSGRSTNHRASSLRARSRHGHRLTIIQESPGHDSQTSQREGLAFEDRQYDLVAICWYFGGAQSPHG
jgi:hypothetical protein